ncbi:hypothetical protein FACS189443_2920 [Planctomycetales bacterium]|nr:hypothetical protein FACS189443_2920 [Planctomycetales bacterium]
MSKKVRITVDKDAAMTVKTEGYEGVSCKDASKILEALGRVTSDTPTSDLYEHEQIWVREVFQA